jgi:hypothetical protein
MTKSAKREKANAQRRKNYRNKVLLPAAMHESLAEWPATYDAETYEALVRSCTSRFLDLTSQEAITEQPCSVCGEDRLNITPFAPDLFPGLQNYLARKHHLSLNNDGSNVSTSPVADLAPAAPVDPRLEYLEPSAFLLKKAPGLLETLTYHNPWTGEHLSDFDGLILDTNGFVLHDDVLHMNVCDTCRSPLSTGKVPARSVANDNWMGQPDPGSTIAKDLDSLTWAELQLLALERTRIVLNLRGANIYTKDLKQRGARGNAISHKHDTHKVCKMLPRPVESLVEVLKVIFVSNRPVTAEDLKWAALVDLTKVVRCFEWLQLNHPDYADIELHHDYHDLDPTTAPFVPECVLVSTTELEDDSVGDGAHTNAGHGNCPMPADDSDNKVPLLLTFGMYRPMSSPLLFVVLIQYLTGRLCVASPCAY